METKFCSLLSLAASQYQWRERKGVRKKANQVELITKHFFLTCHIIFFPRRQGAKAMVVVETQQKIDMKCQKNSVLLFLIWRMGYVYIQAKFSPAVCPTYKGKQHCMHEKTHRTFFVLQLQSVICKKIEIVNRLSPEI